MWFFTPPPPPGGGHLGPSIYYLCQCTKEAKIRQFLDIWCLGSQRGPLPIAMNLICCGIESGNRGPVIAAKPPTGPPGAT